MLAPQCCQENLKRNYGGSHSASMALEVKQIRQLDDERTLPGLMCKRASSVVVDDVEIAEWMMNQIEADIRTHQMRVRVVLDECIQKSTRRKSVNDLRSDQFRCE